jgi:hypothetical protein
VNRDGKGISVVNTAERRSIRRHPVNINATIITPNASIPARAVDISAGGIRVLSPEPIPPDTVVALSLNTNSETLLSGYILWVVEYQRENKPPLFEIGIESHAFILEEEEAICLADRETLIEEILSRI